MNLKEKSYYTLNGAILYNRADIVKLFTSSSDHEEYYSDKEEWTIKTAIIYADLKIFILLVESGNDYFLKEDRRDYLNSMKMCISNNRLDIIKYMVEKMKIDVNMLPEDKQYCHTFVQMACEKGNLEILKYLVSKGADINAKPSCFTSLGLALYNKNKDVAEYLIRNGFKSMAHEQPIVPCILFGWKDIAILLIEKGIDVNRLNCNTTNESDSYPLQAAIEVKSIELVKKLLEYGADPTILRKGRNALEFSKSKGYENITKLLQSKVPGPLTEYNEADCLKYLGYLESLRKNKFNSLQSVPPRFITTEMKQQAKVNEVEKELLTRDLANKAKNYKPWGKSPHWV